MARNDNFLVTFLTTTMWRFLVDSLTSIWYPIFYNIPKFG